MQVGDLVWRLDRSLIAQEHEGFGRVATGDATFTDPCVQCGRRGIDFGQPPVSVRWVRGEPRVLADAVWPLWGLGEVFVSPRIAAAIEGLEGVRLAPIALGDQVEDRETGRPRGAVPHAVRGDLSSYRELRADTRVKVVLTASSVEYGPQGAPCSICGRFAISWGPPGPRAPGVSQPPVAFVPGAEYLETVSTEIDARGELVRSLQRRPPTEGEGLGFSLREAGGANLWRALQYPNSLLCNSTFKTAVEVTGASNIEFLQVGRLVDDR